MNADYCPACRQPAGACEVCGKPAQLHEHLYGEWFCRRCWELVPGSVRSVITGQGVPGAESAVYRVEPMSTGSGGR